MEPIKHPHHNFTYRAPPGMDNCADLSVCISNHGIESAWQPTTEELKALMTGAHIRIMVMTDQQPVMAVGVCDSARVPAATKIAQAILAIERAAAELALDVQAGRAGAPGFREKLTSLLISIYERN